MGFKTIYWTPISGSYFLKGSILEKCGNFWKNGCFSGRIWPDWGNTARADMAGLGSIGCSEYSRDRKTVVLQISKTGASRGCLETNPILCRLTPEQHWISKLFDISNVHTQSSLLSQCSLLFS